MPRHQATLTVALTAALGASAVLDSRAQRVGFDVFEKSILELQNAMIEGTTSSVEIVEQYLARIEAYDQAGPRLNAMIALNPQALDQAAALDDERRTRGSRGPLHGVPVVIKDNFETADMPTTGGSLALEGFQTGRDAFQVRKLRDAGAVIIGKTNLHELAYGITTISSLGGQTRNPYDPTRNPGGSSGGTGAAVAASFAAAGMGSDTCGSIRIPAAHNNLVGLRPTMGLSSRDGVMPLSHSQDVAGPLAKNVTDLAIMLDATVGFDPADPVTADGQGQIPRTYLAALNDSSLNGVRVGILRSLFGDDPQDQEVTALVRRALETMGSIGAEVFDLDIPALEDMLQDTGSIAAEFKFDLMDFLARHPNAPVRSLNDLLKTGLYHTAVDGVFRRAEAGAARSSDTVADAQARRDAVYNTIVQTMTRLQAQVLAYPTVRRKAAPIGAPQVGSNCQLSATTGLPALSVPAGFTRDGLPVGLELLGTAFSEGILLKTAYAYERLMNPRRAPALTPPLP